MTVKVAVYIFFISSIPLPERSQERFDLESKVISAKTFLLKLEEIILQKDRRSKYQPKIDLDSFAWQKVPKARTK